MNEFTHSQQAAKMDVSKYRTRFPPREHEEAVRMLLEGLENQPQAKNNTRTTTLQRRTRRPEGDVRDQTPAATRPHKQQEPLHVKQTEDLVYSSSSVDSGSLARCSAEQADEEFDFEQFGEFPSKNRDEQRENDFDEDLEDDEDLEFTSEDSQECIRAKNHHQTRCQPGDQVAAEHYESHARFPLPNMQSKATSTASDSMSISGASSDRLGSHKSNASREMEDDNDDLNGNYEAIPSRTIAIQCDLKLSSVRRGETCLDSASSDVASMQASSISSTRYGFYRLSSDLVEQRRRLARSVSSRNIAELDAGTGRRVTSRRKSVEAPTSMSELSSAADEFEAQAAGPKQRGSTGASDCDSPPVTRSKLDQRFFSQRHQQQEASSRARQDSLPRRPKTALSQVSSSRLRLEAADSEMNDNSDAASGDGRRPLMRTRAMSHQVLSSSSREAPRQRGPDFVEANVHSNSDSEGPNRVAQQEELVLTRRGKLVGGSSPQVRRHHALRDGPLLRRATTLANGHSQQRTNETSRVENGLQPPDSSSPPADHLHTRQLNRPPEASTWRRAPSAHRPNYSTDEENQLASIRRAIPSRESSAQRRVTNDGKGVTSQRFSSMSLSRRPQVATSNLMTERGSCDLVHKPRAGATQIEMVATSSPRSNRTALSNQATGQNNQSKAKVSRDSIRVARGGGARQTNYVARASSMKQERAPATSQTAKGRPSERRQRLPGDVLDCDDCQPPVASRLECAKRPESDDSESPLTRTWANPSQAAACQLDQEESSLEFEPPVRGARTSGSATRTGARGELTNPLNRKSLRSHSLRGEANPPPGVNSSARSKRFETIYRAGQQDDSEHSEFCSDSMEENQAGQTLDFDSQQRLNEIGLPGPNELDDLTGATATTGANKRSSSHLGLASIPSGLVNRFATTSRATRADQQHHRSNLHLEEFRQQHSRPHQPGPAIAGRAMSQQSLTRPTMPLSRRLRRSGGTVGAGSGSGSDLGGSSISLISRLRDGSRYENAHTRSPVVMLIPQAKPADPLRSSSRRATGSKLGRTLSRGSASRVSSQDRKWKSSSRNGSDSESSSSMLRTLIKPRPAGNAATLRQTETRASRRTGNSKLDSEDENSDGIGQLASEMDSYKFRRRYSVPKDAKINWFSKLKQRVTSSKG